MRGLKITGIVLGVLIAFVAVALLAVHLFVNPNDFKGRIVTAVKDSTGRELALPGDIRLSVFPSVALELGPASLGNPPGFSAQPFATVKRMELHVKLLPLLRKQLRVGRVEVDGLDLRLEKNAAGKGNWEGFGTGKGGASPAPASGGGSLAEVAAVVLKDGRLSYQGLVADQVALEVGHFAAGVSTPVKGSVSVRMEPQAPPLNLSVQLEVVPDIADKRYQVNGLKLTVTRSARPGLPAATYVLSTPKLEADLAAETLSAPAFAAQAGEARVAGTLAGTRIASAPEFSGTFKLDPVAPRPLMEQWGVAAPKTRDPTALSRVAASGSFRYGGNALELRELDLRLDDSTLRGTLAVTDLDTKALSFDLGLDRIDFDRYRSPEEPAPAKKAPAKATELPTDTLKTLRINGKLTAGAATVAGLKLTAVAVTVVARDGLTHVAPATAKLYGGGYSGDITLDGRGEVPLLKLEQSMTGIDAAQLVHDFAKSDRISGRGNLTMNLAARGTQTDALLASLAGHVAATLDNGALEGVDLWFEINRAMTVIQKQSLPSGQSSGRTRFDTFKASADVAGGIASTKDLTIASQNLRIAGQGTANLLSQAINYQLKATVLKDAAKAAGGTNVLADIPVTVTGTLAKPKVSPDLEGLAKAQVQQQLDKHKDELKQKLQDQLQNLLKK